MKIAYWVAVGVVGALLGCGQKGPLVLPDAQHPHKKIALPKPPTAPQASPVPPGTAAPAPSAPAPSATAPDVPPSAANRCVSAVAYAPPS